MRRWVWWLISAGCAGAVFSPSAVALDFRGIKLGMPLVEFRNVQLPETAGGKVVCQYDPETETTRPLRELMSAGTEVGAGVRGCGFYRLGRVTGPAFAPLPPEWISLRLKLADTEVAPVFWFVPDPADGKTMRLFRIVLHTNVMQWDRVEADTTRRHGKPTSVTKTPTVLGTGGRWDNVVVRWQVGDEELILTKRDGRTERMGVQYLDRRLAVAAASQSAADAASADCPAPQPRVPLELIPECPEGAEQMPSGACRPRKA